jgi:hypothetical protein
VVHPGWDSVGACSKDPLSEMAPLTFQDKVVMAFCYRESHKALSWLSKRIVLHDLVSRLRKQTPLGSTSSATKPAMPADSAP